VVGILGKINSDTYQRLQNENLSHADYAENAELPVLSTWFTLALEYTELTCFTVRHAG
jgi:hypothetical protein